MQMSNGEKGLPACHYLENNQNGLISVAKSYVMPKSCFDKTTHFQSFTFNFHRLPKICLHIFFLYNFLCFCAMKRLAIKMHLK